MEFKYVMTTLLIAGSYLGCSEVLNRWFNTIVFHPMRALTGILLWFAFGIIFYLLARRYSLFPFGIAIFGGLVAMSITLWIFQLLFLLEVIPFNVRFFSVYANISLILSIIMIIFLIDKFFKRS